MISAGQTIANPNGGGLGVILNVREIAQTADGRMLAEYEAVQLQRQGGTPTSQSPYSVAGTGSDSARTRIVDPRTLTEAQAVAGGVSRAEYREAVEANEKNNSSQGNNSPGRDLDPAEEAVVNQLRARDSAVRQEEEAHADERVHCSAAVVITFGLELLTPDLVDDALADEHQEVVALAKIAVDGARVIDRLLVLVHLEGARDTNQAGQQREIPAAVPQGDLVDVKRSKNAS